MSIMKGLEEQLNEEIKGAETPPETNQDVNELYEQMIEKKFNDMELRLNASMKKLIENAQKTPPTNVEQKGDTDDSHTD